MSRAQQAVSSTVRAEPEPGRAQETLDLIWSTQNASSPALHGCRQGHCQRDTCEAMIRMRRCGITQPTAVRQKTHRPACLAERQGRVRRSHRCRCLCASDTSPSRARAARHRRRARAWPCGRRPRSAGSRSASRAPRPGPERLPMPCSRSPRADKHPAHRAHGTASTPHRVKAARPAPDRAPQHAAVRDASCGAASHCALRSPPRRAANSQQTTRPDRAVRPGSSG